MNYKPQLGWKCLSAQSWPSWACFPCRSMAPLASERALQHLLPCNSAWPMPPRTIIPRNVYTSLEAKECPEGGVMRSAPRQRLRAASRADAAMITVLPGATPHTDQPPRNRFTWREPATSAAGPSHPSPRPYNIPHATAGRSRWHEAIGHTATTPCACAQAFGRCGAPSRLQRWRSAHIPQRAVFCTPHASARHSRHHRH